MITGSRIHYKYNTASWRILLVVVWIATCVIRCSDSFQVVPSAPSYWRFESTKLLLATTSGTTISSSVTVESGSCVGSGSYGTVHYLTTTTNTAVDTKDDSGNKNTPQSSTYVGKRAFTESELKELNSGFTKDELKDKTTRCRYYWLVEKHCFEKIDEPVPGLPKYRGTADDAEGLSWMLFDCFMADPEHTTKPGVSLQELIERDRIDHHENREHHLYLTSKALGLVVTDDDGSSSSTLTQTLDVVLEQLLTTLSHVHSYSIVHRDVKPDNLCVCNGHLVLIDFGSAADLSTAGLMQENIGLSSRVAISPIYAAPEVFVDAGYKEAVNFDVFSVALLYCQLLFQYLDDRQESGFRQQLTSANYDLDVWLQNALQSKVRPTGLDEALEVLQERPGLWKLLQDMLIVDPRDRLSSKDALTRWEKVLKTSLLDVDERKAVKDRDLFDGPFLQEVLESLQVCDLPTVRPLQFVATFQRKRSLGLMLAERDGDTSDMDEESLEAWNQAVVDAEHGEVFVQGIVPGGQAEELEIFSIGDRLQGIGELPLSQGGFERAVEMLEDQPRSSANVVLHFDRKSALVGEPDADRISIPAFEGPIQVSDQGAWSVKGRRKAQEDAFVLHEVHDTKDRSILLAGVLDGHLGAVASNFVRDELPVAFSTELNLGNSAKVENLLETSWNTCCDGYRSMCSSDDGLCIADYDAREGTLMAYTGSQDASAGTTGALFALDKQKGRLAALNCGDSRGIVIGSEGKLRFQTVDHKPETEIERLKEGREQGFDYSIPKCRVARWTIEVGDYDYAVARSLEGPYATAKGIVSLADVSTVQAEPGMTVVVATDGLWEVIDSEEACRIASRLRTEETSAGDTAKELCKLAYDKGSSDNLSAVVLHLD